MSFLGAISEELFLWGAFLALPGSIHTIVRAELYAVLVVVRNAAGQVTVVTDSKVNADIYAAGEDDCARSANADLWAMLWKLLREKGMQLHLLWSKGHADSIEVFETYSVTRRNLFGNLCADRLAARGAELCQVSLQDSVNLKWHYATVKRVQSRAVVVLANALQRESTLVKPPKATKLRKISTMGLCMASRHEITAIANTLHCHKCLKHSAASSRGRAEFLASPCVIDTALLKDLTLGNTKPTKLPVGKRVKVGNSLLDASHALSCYRGLYYCTSCGYHASVKAQHLLKPCIERGVKAGSRVRILQAGRLPSGMKAWPNQSTRKVEMVELEDDDEA